MNVSINGSHLKMHDTSVNTKLSFYSSSIDVSKVREAEEENLVKLFVEEFVHLTYLESLVVELAKRQGHIGILLEKEAHENMESQALKFKDSRRK